MADCPVTGFDCITCEGEACQLLGWVQPKSPEARIIKLEAENDALRTLLARNLVFDFGSAEDAVEALGGWPATLARVLEHKGVSHG